MMMLIHALFMKQILSIPWVVGTFLGLGYRLKKTKPHPLGADILTGETEKKQLWWQVVIRTVKRGWLFPFPQWNLIDWLSLS